MPAYDLFLPLPLVPLQGESLQGESLQGEPLSTNVERGIGGEVSKNVTFIDFLRLSLSLRILSTKLGRILKTKCRGEMLSHVPLRHLLTNKDRSFFGVFPSGEIQII